MMWWNGHRQGSVATPAAAAGISSSKQLRGAADGAKNYDEANGEGSWRFRV